MPNNEAPSGPDGPESRDYRVSEGTFTVPAGWSDRSINLLTPTDLGIAGASLVLARDQMPVNGSLKDYADKQRAGFEREMKDFALLEDLAGKIDGRPAHMVAFTWVVGEKPVYQAQVSVQNASQILNFTATVPQHLEDHTLRRLLMRCIASFRFSEPSAP